MSDENERSAASAGSVDGDPRKYPASTPQVPLVPAAMYHALVVAHAEIARLRLTDAERTLICRLAAACEGGHPREWTNRALTADDRATLRGLLERLGGGNGFDRQSAETEKT